MNQEIQNNFIVKPFKADLIMERKNDIPFEHQILFILRRYDSVMAENIELRKEIEELTEALDELGGNDERKSLKKRIKKLSEKNESLKQKLSEKNKQYDEVYRMYKMLALVDIPALKLLSQRIIKDVNLVEHTNCVYEEVQ